MNLEQEREKLEQIVIKNPGFLGIGIVLQEGRRRIEIAVKDQATKKELGVLLQGKTWNEVPVEIIIREQTSI